MLEYRATKSRTDCIIQFWPIEKHKFLRFVGKVEAKGFNRHDIQRGMVPFGCGLIDFLQHFNNCC